MAYIPHEWPNYCKGCKYYDPNYGCNQPLGEERTLCLVMQANIPQKGRKISDCTTCIYEYQCDWAEAEAGECSHYRLESGCKKVGEVLDKKSLYIKSICDLADVAGLDIEGIISVKDKKDQTSSAVIITKR